METHLGDFDEFSKKKKLFINSKKKNRIHYRISNVIKSRAVIISICYSCIRDKN